MDVLSGGYEHKTAGMAAWSLSGFPLDAAGQSLGGVSLVAADSDGCRQRKPVVLLT
jgi:hypothetical protein